MASPSGFTSMPRRCRSARTAVAAAENPVILPPNRRPKVRRWQTANLRNLRENPRVFAKVRKVRGEPKANLRPSAKVRGGELANLRNLCKNPCFFAKVPKVRGEPKANLRRSAKVRGGLSPNLGNLRENPCFFAKVRKVRGEDLDLRRTASTRASPL